MSGSFICINPAFTGLDQHGFHFWQFCEEYTNCKDVGQQVSSINLENGVRKVSVIREEAPIDGYASWKTACKIISYVIFVLPIIALIYCNYQRNSCSIEYTENSSISHAVKANPKSLGSATQNEVEETKNTIPPQVSKNKSFFDRVSSVIFPKKNKISEYVSSFTYAGEGFLKNGKIRLKNINALVSQNVLAKKSHKVIAYDKEEVQKTFDFNMNGFMFSSFDGELLNEISRFDSSDNDQEIRILKLIEEMLANWAEEQGIEYDRVIPLAITYRNESPTEDLKVVSSPVPLTHIDFNGKNTKEFMGAFRSIWKAPMERALGKELTDEEFENTQIVEMVNIWLPLKSKPTENTLAVMDTRHVKEEDLIPYTASVGSEHDPMEFTSFAMRPSDAHEYVIQSDMKRGDMVLFKTLATPHTAVTIERPESAKKLARESIEIRVIFTQKQSLS